MQRSHFRPLFHFFDDDRSRRWCSKATSLPVEQPLSLIKALKELYLDKNLKSIFKWAIPASFYIVSLFSTKLYKFYYKLMWKNGAGIRVDNLKNMTTKTSKKVKPQVLKTFQLSEMLLLAQAESTARSTTTKWCCTTTTSSTGPWPSSGSSCGTSARRTRTSCTRWSEHWEASSCALHSSFPSVRHFEKVF